MLDPSLRLQKKMRIPPGPWLMLDFFRPTTKVHVRLFVSLGLRSAVRYVIRCVFPHAGAFRLTMIRTY